MPVRELLADTARLAAVSRVLPVAQANQAAMDRLAELAAIVMDAPIGMINMIGERHQHLVGLAGMGEPYASSRQASVDTGFCPATAQAGRPLYIEDATEDPDFLDHPAVTELRFIAYAGCPLRDVDGQLIGTLCVIDTRPHRWRRADRRALEALAESVVSEVALHRDIDRRQRLLDAFDVAPAAIAVTRGPQHVVDYHNPAHRAIFGDLPLGVPAREALPELPGELFALMEQVLSTGETFTATDAALTMTWRGEPRPRERFFDFSYSAISREPGPAPDPGNDAVADRRGLLVVVVEVTDRVQARRDLLRHARRQELLARASAALNRKLDPATELAELARVAVPELADLSSVHLLARPVPPGQMPALPVVTDRVAVAAAPGRTAPALCQGLRWNGDGDPVTETIRRGALSARSFAPSSPPSWAHTAGTATLFPDGLQHLACAPVVVDGQVVAVMAIGLWPGRPAWTDDELATLGDVAGYAGIALGHSLSYKRTRDSALTLQRSLLTEPPIVEGLQICARYQPAGRDEVGGDWYDAFERRPGQLAVVIGDVIGHDIAAAGAMGQLRASLRSLALDRNGGPAAALDRLAAVNEQLAITRFATLVHGHLTRETDRWNFTWATAGHPPPLLVTDDGHARLLEEASGMALVPGLARPHIPGETTLPAGSTLLLYTDGLIERRHTDLVDNLAQMCARAAAAAGLPIEQLCDEILRDAATDDDVALLALRVSRPVGDGGLGRGDSLRAGMKSQGEGVQPLVPRSRRARAS